MLPPHGCARRPTWVRRYLATAAMRSGRPVTGGSAGTPKSKSVAAAAAGLAPASLPGMPAPASLLGTPTPAPASLLGTPTPAPASLLGTPAPGASFGVSFLRC